MSGQITRATPRVSVIIATYNYSAVLRYAVQTDVLKVAAPAA